MNARQSVASMGLAVLIGMAAATPTAGQQMTDAQVRRAIVRESIANYPGSCPCPDSVMRNGSRCGGRSAYSRPGGAAPMCYPSDVTAAQIAAYRRGQA